MLTALARATCCTCEPLGGGVQTLGERTGVCPSQMDVLETTGVGYGCARGLAPKTVKAGAFAACVLLRDGELPGGRRPDFHFCHLPLPALCCCILVRLISFLYGPCGIFVW